MTINSNYCYEDGTLTLDSTYTTLFKITTAGDGSILKYGAE
jgi:hypothetical protein